jgi:hypothetical protein
MLNKIKQKRFVNEITLSIHANKSRKKIYRQTSGIEVEILFFE